MINIYTCGMGGQGIGFFTKLLFESCLEARYRLKGCDTHGLAQRGGVVVSHLRLGENVFAPRIPKGQADIILGLERLEAFRAMQLMAKMDAHVLYYDAVYPPASVRTGQEEYPDAEMLNAAAKKKKVNVTRVFYPDLPDPRMQNIVILASLVNLGLIKNLTAPSITAVMERFIPPRLMNKNLELFKTILQS